MTDAFESAAAAPAADRQARYEARARWELGVYTFLVVAASAATIIMSNIWADLPPAKVLSQCVRFVATCGLMCWLWSGSLAARWVCVVLFGLGGAAATFAGLLLMTGHAAGELEPAPGALTLFAVMQAAYLPLAIRLALPGAVSRFLRRRRERLAGPRVG